MKLICLFILSILCTSVGQAQTPAELNAQLRQELLTVKAKSEEIKPVFDKLYLAFNTYSDSLLLQFKAIPFNQLVDSYLTFKAYQDSIECINWTYSKTIPFNDLLSDDNFPARNKFTPCNVALGEVLNVKHNVNYYPHDVVLGQKSLEEENIDLEESIQGYIIKNSRMLLFLDEASSGFNQGQSIESSINYLKAAYELKLTEVNQYTAVLKDTVAQARKLYLANPETSKYKHCFYKVKPVSYSESPSKEPVIYSVTDEIPEFIGGREAMNKYLSENLVYPESAKKKRIEGKVYLKFVVSETGNVSNVKVQKGIADCQECDAEAVRVVNNMPDWKPAKTNGKPVNSWYNLPVSFKIQ